MANPKSQATRAISRAIVDPTEGNINRANGLIDSVGTGAADDKFTSREVADFKKGMREANRIII